MKRDRYRNRKLKSMWSWERYSAMGLGGFTGTDGCLLAPTVEGYKIFKGRVSSSSLHMLSGANRIEQSKFHSNSCYDIGPYKSTKSMFLLAITRRYITIPMLLHQIWIPISSKIRLSNASWCSCHPMVPLLCTTPPQLP